VTREKAIDFCVRSTFGRVFFTPTGPLSDDLIRRSISQHELKMIRGFWKDLVQSGDLDRDLGSYGA